MNRFTETNVQTITSSNKKQKLRSLLSLVFSLFFLVSCGGGGDSDEDPVYKVGGTVSGLTTGPLEIELNDGTETLTINTDGSFQFSHLMLPGWTYEVRVVDEPFGLSCSVLNGTGIISDVDITDVVISCEDITHTVSGSVSGLTSGSLEIELNDGTESLTINADGSFQFSHLMLPGWVYEVQVVDEPFGLECSVVNGGGIISDIDITDVVISCEDITHTVGGSVSGLTSGTLEIELNDGTETLPINADGSFQFSHLMLPGWAYEVRVVNEPFGLSCGILNGDGIISDVDITDVVISCEDITHTVGGSVSGLISGTLEIELNDGTESLIINADGSFQFSHLMLPGWVYEVRVVNEPFGLSCGILNGGGIISDVDITDVSIICEDITYSVGGTVSGLSGTLVIKYYDSETLVITDNGSYQLSTVFVQGWAYEISVFSQPEGQICTLSNYLGTVSTSDITNVDVNCVNTYSVGGTVSGLSGNVTLQNNGSDDLLISADGVFNFAGSLAEGASYNVTVASQPADQVCSISNSSGTISVEDVNNVAVSCVDVLIYTVGGTVTGLDGSLTLTNNAMDSVFMSADGTFTFTDPVSDGASYDVAVAAQPTGQTCTVTNGSGTINAADISNVTISCVTNSYTVGGVLSALSGSVTLQNNGVDDLVLTEDGVFTFATPILHGDSFDVTVSSEPLNQTCSVTSGSGTINGADVVNVNVLCKINIYTVGGTVQGLNGELILQNNGADDLTIYLDGAFTFVTKVAAGGSYNVTVSSQPDGQSCTVSNGSGTLGGLIVPGEDVTDVYVMCENFADIFVEPMFAGALDSTYSIAMGDLDGDGDIDMVKGNSSQPNRVWFNNGFGNYQMSSQDLGTGTGPEVALGDLDGDGDLDLIVGNGSPYQPNKVWFNNGKGFFTDSGQALGDQSTNAIELGDVDGDGDLDFIEAVYFFPDQVWLNDGSGSFTDSGQLLNNTLNGITSDVELADLDGDTDLDLLVGGPFAERIWWNDGSGNFLDSGQRLGSESVVDSTNSLSVGDIDGDSDLDFIVGNYNQPNTVWVNNGFGGFTDSSQYLGNSETQQVILSDLDGDGDLDIAEVNSDNIGFNNTIWINDGTGGFVDSNVTGITAGSGSIAASDVDGDGDQDLLSGSPYVDNIWLNNGQNPVDFTATYQPLGSSDSTSTVQMADLDGDGDLDIVFGNAIGTTGQADTIWINDGEGNFSDSGQALGLSPSMTVALADVDLDNDIDLVIGHFNDIANSVWLNDGDGIYTDSGQVLGSSNTRSLAVGDIDADGDPDLIAGNGNGTSSSVAGEPNIIWLNNGSGVFTDSGHLGNDDTRRVVLEDMDGDGDLDIVSGNFGTVNGVWSNDGSGGFTDSGLTFGISVTLTLSQGDFDGDGDIDIVEGTRAGDVDTVWLNDGTGQLNDSGQLLGDDVDDTFSIAVGDLDGDSDLDLVTVKMLREVDIWINNGSGVFFSSGQKLERFSSTSGDLGDVDGDGDLDLVTGISGSPNQVYINNFAP